MQKEKINYYYYYYYYYYNIFKDVTNMNVKNNHDYYEQS